jgi:hypothetical protein
VDREQQSTPPGATRATPPKSRSKTEPSKAARPKAAASRAKGAGGTPPATSAPDIMSRLPKSRPQRSSQRRRPPVAAAAKSTSGRSPSAPKRPVSTGARRPAAARPATPARPPATQSRSAPGLPRLAIDGATEAVKLPLKVGGRLTLRALDAVARGLRRR